MLLCMGLSLTNFKPLENLERYFIDNVSNIPIKNHHFYQPSVIIDIDEDSISKLGSWPWPRSYFSSLINFLNKAEAKTICINVLFDKKENSRIIGEIKNIRDTFTTLIQDPSVHHRIFLSHIKEIEEKIDNDTKLLNSISNANNVLLPASFKLNKWMPGLNQNLNGPQIFDNLDLPLTSQTMQIFSPHTANSVATPFSEMTSVSIGLGHVNILQDIDGQIREHILAIMYKEKYYPSLPLRAMIHYLGLQQKDLEILPPHGLRAGNRYVETDNKINIRIKKLPFEVTTYSFYDVLKGKIPERVFKDRIVLIGGKASIINTGFSRDLPKDFSLPQYQATVIGNILSNTIITRPEWAHFIELAIMIFLGFYLIFILPRNSLLSGVFFTLLFILVWTTGCAILLSSENLWIKWVYPFTELLLGLFIIIPRQVFATDKGVTPVLQTMIQRHPQAHKTLDQYEVEEELGRGMLGVVYRANDKENGRWVAIKTIQINTVRVSEQIENARNLFIKEAQAFSRLRHQKIVEVYDVGIENDICYIVMEFLDGRSLDTHFTQKTLLPLRKVLHYIIQISEALSYAHQKWIIHGGIKPGNIFLLRKDIIKVTDFGVDPFAKAIGNQTGEMLITPGYISPEQVEGKKIDGRSDLFSLGVLLYHLVTGELPFQGGSLSELMYNISNQEPVSPKAINPKVPTALEMILMKALNKDQNERFQSAESFGRHLRILDEKIKMAVNKKKRR